MASHNPARELEIIQQFESTQMKAGETWYLIDLPWLQSWLAYAFENRDEHGLAPRPGPVTNHTLVDVTSGTFRSELEITRDFRVINASTWNVYLSKYGGQSRSRQTSTLTTRLAGSPSCRREAFLWCERTPARPR